MRSALATAGFLTLCLTAPVAAAAPSSDMQGYLDSTARCDAPNTAVAFGSTDSSRIAICKKPDGTYEYRGVRLRDGAKLILTATPSGAGTYVANNDGITYTLNKNSLVVSSGGRTIREETITDYHEPSAPPTTPSTTPSTTTTPISPTPTSPTPTSPTAATSTTATIPLPPPLPAEAGGQG